MAEVAFSLEADAMTNDAGTGFTVYPRIKVLETKTENIYMVQSYLLLNGVIAKDYGNGADLNQVSSLPKVSTGSGSTPTSWAQDAAVVNGTALITSGTIYTHDEVLYDHATTWPRIYRRCQKIILKTIGKC